MQAALILIGAAIVAKKRTNGNFAWLLTKQSDEGGWEIPKVTVRRGESSVRAVIRMMAEQGGMNAKILEESLRQNGTTLVNNRSVPKRVIYYLMIQKSAGEIFGFRDTAWFDISKAVKSLELKKDIEALKNSEKILKDLTKRKKT